LGEIEEGAPGADIEKAGIVNQQKLEKKFGQSFAFVASTLLENGGTLKTASPASLLKEAIHGALFI
jgi:cellulose synthase A